MMDRSRYEIVLSIIVVIAEEIFGEDEIIARFDR